MSRTNEAIRLRQLADDLNASLEDPQERSERAKKGQFATPSQAAATIAATLDLPVPGKPIRVLDPGAGAGALTIALVALWVERGVRVSAEFDLVESDENASRELATAVAECKAIGARHGLDLSFNVHEADFCDTESWSPAKEGYDIAILNPPYQKLNKGDPTRLGVQRSVGVDCPNLYASFLAAATALLKQGGSLAAITPRSFSNGLYFGGFRQYLLRNSAIRHVVLFDRRDSIFKSSSVLQETVIFRADKTASRAGDSVTVETRADHVSQPIDKHDVKYDVMVSDADADNFINLPGSPEVMKVISAMSRRPSTLGDLEMSVSTGQVVDFRSKESLAEDGAYGAIPLIYPTNLRDGLVRWPVETKKAQGFLASSANAKMTMPNGYYVLVKRFTSKEERRRVVASVYEPIDGYESVAFENHVNIFHRDRGPLSQAEAEDLAAYLNSEAVDIYFRMFSGSTQVNATDLRRLRFPSIHSPQDPAEIDLRSAQGKLFGIGAAT